MLMMMIMMMLTMIIMMIDDDDDVYDADDAHNDYYDDDDDYDYDDNHDDFDCRKKTLFLRTLLKKKTIVKKSRSLSDFCKN